MGQLTTALAAVGIAAVVIVAYNVNYTEMVGSSNVAVATQVRISVLPKKRGKNILLLFLNFLYFFVLPEAKVHPHFLRLRRHPTPTHTLIISILLRSKVNWSLRKYKIPPIPAGRIYVLHVLSIVHVPPLSIAPVQWFKSGACKP